MKVLVRFGLDCGRMGSLDGMFVTTVENLESIYGKEVYFGEVLGKHSDICATLDSENFNIISEDQDFVEKFEAIARGCGYNPFDYVEGE